MTPNRNTPTRPRRHAPQRVGTATTLALLLSLGGLAAPTIAADASKANDASRADQASLGNVTAQQFATQAAEGGLAEVQLSQLARQQASSAEVRQFAERMLEDHTKANAELQAIAKQKGMTLPRTLNEEHVSTMKTLQTKTGAEFDAAYMAAMKKDHVKTIALFQAANGPSFDDAALKAFASKTLPVLQEHHKRVMQIEEKMGGSTAAR